MALKVTQSQYTKAYLVATSVVVATAAGIKTAITGGKEIACLLDLGDISLGTRSSKEFTCMSNDESYKALGSLTLGSIAPQLLYDPADALGQADLRDMWANSTRRTMIIALNDQITPTTGNPTFLTFEVALSQSSIGIAKDDGVMYKPTLEICTKVAYTKAT